MTIHCSEFSENYIPHWEESSRMSEPVDTAVFGPWQPSFRTSADLMSPSFPQSRSFILTSNPDDINDGIVVYPDC